MFVDESLWIRDALAAVPLAPGASLLDVGSSTLHFRTVAQSWVDGNVFAPLRARGVRILHLDARSDPGVDIVADAAQLDGIDQAFDVVVAANVLEHVIDRDGTLRNLRRLVRPGGLLPVTVPHRYPLHPDPIDTGFRPTADVLAALIGWPDLLRQEVLAIGEREHYHGARFWRRRLRPWQVACILVRRPG